MSRLLKGDLVITDPCYTHDYNPRKEICRGTIYGDWSCHTFKGTREEVQDKIKEWQDYYAKAWHDVNFELQGEEKETKRAEMKAKREELEKDTYGQFCADSGQVCVFIMDDDNYPFVPKFKKWAKEHPWCLTIIPDFEGTVEELVIDDELHLVGKGNKPFFTAQTGF